jgi:hypothetical protein
VKLFKTKVLFLLLVVLLFVFFRLAPKSHAEGNWPTPSETTIPESQHEYGVWSYNQAKKMKALQTPTINHELPPMDDQTNLGNLKYSTYTDPKYGFEIKYPSGVGDIQQGVGLINIQIGKSLLTDQKDCVISANCLLNKDRHSWKSEYEKHLNNNNVQIVYKTFNSRFFVISGTYGNKIYYFKEIPFQRDGKWFSLFFNITFIQSEKKFWDPVLIECAKSIKPVQSQSGTPFTLGWPNLVDDKKRVKLLDLAKQWIISNVHCAQNPNIENKNVKPMLGKCIIDDFNETFFRLSDQSPIRFLLSVHGPSYLKHLGNIGYQCSDQKFVLFTFENGELSEKIIYKTSISDSEDFSGVDAYTDYRKALEFIDFPDGSQGLLLNISRGDTVTMGHLFKEDKGKLKDVLDFEESVIINGRLDGPCFDSVLVPNGKNDLKVVKRNWVYHMGDDQNPANDNYTAINYHYDPNVGEYQIISGEENLSGEQIPDLWPARRIHAHAMKSQ